MMMQMLTVISALICGSLGVALLVEGCANAFYLQKNSQRRRERFLESLGMSGDIDGLSRPCRLMLVVARTLESEGGYKRASGGKLTHLFKANGDRVQEDELLLARSGLDPYLDASLLPEVRMRIAVVVSAALAFIGLLVGPLMALFLLMFGLLLGYRVPDRIMKERIVEMQHICERELPAMLEIIALAVRAGLSFDAALEIYCLDFDSKLAKRCYLTYLDYSQGVRSREEALRALARRLDVLAFTRFVEVTLQAIHFGAPLSPSLEVLAEESRKDYRTRVSMRIAKAPVRMLIPMGTLILPAMLLLVLGPVVLNYAGELL